MRSCSHPVFGSNYFSSGMFISNKFDASYAFVQRYCNFFNRRLAAIWFLQRHYISFWLNICSHPFLAGYFKVSSVYFRTRHRERNFLWKQLHFESSIDYIEMKVATSLKQLLFRKVNFFRTPSCLERLLLSSNYFLVTKTFSDQLLLEDKYFFSTATALEELLLNN